MTNKTIVFTGGHHNSALLIAKALKKKGFEIYWFGHKHTMEKEESLSLEIREVQRAGIQFINLKTAKFYNNYNPLFLIKFIFGFFQSLFHLIKIKPKLIFAFGGYLSVPVGLSGKLLGIKLIISEQTSRAGLANRILSIFADKILLTWSSSQKFFKKKKCAVVGLPLPEQTFKKKKSEKQFDNKLLTILITGGKQGSHVINRAIEERLPVYLKKYNLIHQTGAIKKTNDFERIVEKRKKIDKEYRQRYKLKKFLFREEMIEALKSADLVISRAGAHIIWELAALGKPAILIPYPWAYKDEQFFNAKKLEKTGGAIILKQKNLSAEFLFKQVEKAMGKIDKLSKKAGKMKKLVVRDSKEKIISVIFEQLQ